MCGFSNIISQRIVKWPNGISNITNTNSYGLTITGLILIAQDTKNEVPNLQTTADDCWEKAPTGGTWGKVPCETFLTNNQGSLSWYPIFKTKQERDNVIRNFWKAINKANETGRPGDGGVVYTYKGDVLPTNDSNNNYGGFLYRFDTYNETTLLKPGTQGYISAFFYERGDSYYWMLTSFKASKFNDYQLDLTFKCLGSSPPATPVGDPDTGGNGYNSPTGPDSNSANQPTVPGPSSPPVGPSNAGNTSIVAATFGTPVITNGAITSIPITNGGSGYTVPPIITISGNGSGATAVAVLGTGAQSGTVVSVSITSPGTGYTSASTTNAPSLVGVKLGDPVVVDGVIVSVPILDGGAGQDSATIGITDPSAGASGAVLLPVVADGAVIGIIVSNGGKGYTNPKLTVSNNGVVTGVFGGNSPATNSGTVTSSNTGFTGVQAKFGPLVIKDGVVIDVVIKDGGSGYTEPPIIVLAKPSSSAPEEDRATAIAEITNGKVTKVTVTNGGKGYPITGDTTIGSNSNPSPSGPKPPAVVNPNSNGECPFGYEIFPVYGPNIITGYGTYKNAVVSNICSRPAVVTTACGICKLPEFAMYMINVYCWYLCGGGGGGAQQPNGGGGGRNNGNNLGNVLRGLNGAGGQQNNINLNFGPPPQIPIVIVPGGAAGNDPVPEPPYKYPKCPEPIPAVSYHGIGPNEGIKRLIAPNRDCRKDGIKRITYHTATITDFDCEIVLKQQTEYPTFKGYTNANAIITRVNPDLKPPKNSYLYYPREITFNKPQTFTYCFANDEKLKTFMDNIKDKKIIPLKAALDKSLPQPQSPLPSISSDGKKLFSSLINGASKEIPNNNEMFKIEDA